MPKSSSIAEVQDDRVVKVLLSHPIAENLDKRSVANELQKQPLLGLYRQSKPRQLIKVLCSTHVACGEYQEWLPWVQRTWKRDVVVQV
jgi:hypothetical protein